MKNLYLEDHVLQRYLRIKLGEAYGQFKDELESFGGICAKEIDPRAYLADKYPPRLLPYDKNGNRIDEIEYHPSYSEMEKIAYEYGLVWRFYEKPLRFKRIVGFALGYLFGQVEAGLFCPICMTDGAAYVLSRHADESIKKRFLPRLLARKREALFQGAMFLTEKQGGSDVGQVETKALKKEDHFELFGDKWFCSNVDAECILILAREEGARAGTKGLSLFVLPRYLDDGSRNHYRINRIKDKLGVRSMPTGEVTLEGAIAYRIGQREAGFYLMTDMLNLSRLYNAVASIALMQRALMESFSLAKDRVAFGRRVVEHPLMQRKLLELKVEHEACFYFVFAAVECMDKILASEATETDQKLLRILTPLIKYYTAKKAVWAASEAIEALGGNGYIEDFVTPRLLRDAQVLPIWEGTTNILVLDAFRAMAKEQAHEALLSRVSENLQGVQSLKLSEYKEQVLYLLSEVTRFLPHFAQDFSRKAFYAQDFTDLLCFLFQASEWLHLESVAEKEDQHLDTLEAFFTLLWPKAMERLALLKKALQEETTAS